MNVGIVLDFFPYFLPFNRPGAAHSYYYTTTRRRFAAAPVTPLSFCDPARDHLPSGTEPAGDWLHYFRTALALSSLSGKFSARDLAALYEKHLERFLLSNHLDLLISGGSTAFERCALATARRLKIPALCLWEGFFRPRTITYDSMGMNAESAFAAVPFQEIETHAPSPESKAAVAAFLHDLRQPPAGKPALRSIQNHRFDILRQAQNRWMDRRDVERIRVPLRSHLAARIAHRAHRLQYCDAENITRPFIFFPLQTHTDSNIALHCDLSPYSEVVKTVLSAYRGARESAGCDLIIKEHPLDVFRTSYPITKQDGVFWVPPETPTASLLLHPACKGTVLVNSTAGIESIALGVPVAALGRSIYSRPELVEVVPQPTVDSVAASLARLPYCAVHQSRVASFLHFLYDRAQLPGNLDITPTEEEMSSFERFLTERFS